MRILILSFYYHPDLSAGSFRAKAFVDELLKQAPQDFQFDIVTTAPNRYQSFVQETARLEDHGNHKIYRIDLPRHKSGFFDQAMSYFVFAFRAFKIARKEKYDVVFVTSARLMSAFLGSFIARLNRAYLYLDIRDIFYDTMNDVLPRKLKYIFMPIFNIIEKLTFNRANKINLVSEGFKKYFSSKFPNKSLTFYSNGIDDLFIRKTVTQNQAQKNDPLVILYAGNMGEGQGLDLIIPKIAQELGKEIIFKVIGDGGGRAKLEKEVEGFKNVIIQKPLKREELLVEYEKADVLFLHLNNYEAFEKVLPSKLFEYAATGKPIWAGVSGYSREFSLKEIENIALFCPGDPRSAIESFRKLKIEMTDRAKFVAEFSRKNINEKMVRDFLISIHKTQ